MERTVAVIGAGPAGSTLAHRLASSGERVVLFDPRAPWEKPCGGMLGPGTMAAHPVLQGYPHPVAWHDGIVYESTTGDRKLARGNGRPAVLSRLDLGRFLLDRATGAGAAFVPDRVLRIEEDGAGWTLETPRGAHRADILVGADGVAGVTRRALLGGFPRGHLALTCGYLVEGVPEAQCLIKFLDIDGYLWVFPRADHTSAGIGARLGSLPGRELFRRLDAFLAKHAPDARVLDRYAALIPMAADGSLFEAPGCGPNWVLVGDAAGHVDPIVGEGIAYALASAEAAAEAILGNDPPSYEALWQEAYGKTLKHRASLRHTFSLAAQTFGPEIMLELVFRWLVH